MIFFTHLKNILLLIIYLESFKVTLSQIIPNTVLKKDKNRQTSSRRF